MPRWFPTARRRHAVASLIAVAAVLPVLCSAPTPGQPQACSILDLGGYALTFDDEFDVFSASPDGKGTTWETKYWWGARSLGGRDYYLDASVGGVGQTPYAISDGALVISARPTTPELKAAGVDATFTTGQIDTHNSFSQTYGYFETRAQVSGVYGTNSAFWLMPMSGPWPPEIDVIEVLGRDPATGFMTNHTDAQKPASYGGRVKGRHLSRGFHRYGVMWTPTTLTFYLDGVAVFTTPTRPDQHQPMYMLVTLGVGGSWAGNPDPAGFSADMKVDYVRAYSKDPDLGGTVPNRGSRNPVDAESSPPLSSTCDART
ncbi:MAG: family 16 glycosylhydrolase [Gemmatimonas sp.]